MQNSNIVVISNINFIDYIKYCFYPLAKRKGFKYVLIALFSILLLLVGYTIYFLFFLETKQTAHYLPFITLGLIVGYIVIMFVGGYLRNASDFKEKFRYSFGESGFHITSDKRIGKVSVKKEDIKYAEIKFNSLFVVLNENKYHYIRLTEQNQKDLQDWIKNVSE